MIYNWKKVRLPGAYMLWAPACGAVHGTMGLDVTQARERLADRQANGEAFNGERVKPMWVHLQLDHTGLVQGYLIDGPKAK